MLAILIDERTAKLRAENDRLKLKMENQQKQIDALLKIICAGNRTAEVCREP